MITLSVEVNPNREVEMPEEQVTPEMEEAVHRTLYHHPRSSPAIVQLLTGKTYDVPPLPPTKEQEKIAHGVVEELISIHYSTFRQACIEVTGEDPAENW